MLYPLAEKMVVKMIESNSIQAEAGLFAEFIAPAQKDSYMTLR